MPLRIIANAARRVRIPPSPQRLPPPVGARPLRGLRAADLPLCLVKAVLAPSKLRAAGEVDAVLTAPSMTSARIDEYHL
jgi:hypothetical protein